MATPAGPPDIRQKAKRMNLDPTRYGTFAEIGAGQEVVRWFFRVGAAAGTIAKSISAYDMQVSDAIYGKCKRYVSRERLESMLDYEYRLNLELLTKTRGYETAFFAFADTVAARSYRGSPECHAWMGVRFQAQPRDDDNQIVLHARMLDSDNLQQQEALGILGVNLVYGSCYLSHTPEALLESLLDGLSTERIEIDMIEFSGLEFRRVDNRVMSLKLVQLGLSKAAMFAPDGTVLQPSEVLHKRPVLVQRGSFRPPTHVNADMQRCARQRFAEEPDVSDRDFVSLLEITMSNLTTEGALDLHDFLDRADILAAVGLSVLISDYPEYYRLAAYLARYTNERIGLTLGAGSLREIFNEKYYTDLDGGILEALGRLFKNNIKLYVYPMLETGTDKLITIDELDVPSELRSLYGYLVDRGYMEGLKNFERSYLRIYSRDVLAKIKSGDPSWESMVPGPVAKLLKERGLFGYR